MIRYEAGSYDVIVIGAGHAGCEAALAAARMGMRTLQLTISLDGIALMACNPAIGGTGKGHLVREVDALGGQMALSADATFLQMKMLNTGKGAAVQSLRAQMDKKAYQAKMKSVLENTQNLTLKQAEVVDILVKNGEIDGCVTATGAVYRCRAVILASGVYLKSRVIIGEYSAAAGPSGLGFAGSLSESLRNLGISLQRFKTGTPARVDRRSLDFSKMIVQPGDAKIVPFSFMSGPIEREQLPCYLTYTNERTHEMIRANIGRSPLYSGKIDGIGPRYCPSIEDKVVKFPDKDRHQLFIEPEGANTNETYVQGMSSSLPEEVQIALYRTVPGMEHVEFMRTAYAIEYDCIDPTQLTLALMHREIPGFFFAGQVNGSSGYEEAAAQGVLAGINAVQYLREEPPLVLGRDEAYAGVLVDDLVTKGTSEPYRMMTARAEYRLILRQDNADLRLTERGRMLGLVSPERYDRYMKKTELCAKELARLEARHFPPGEALNAFLAGFGETPARGPMSLADLLRRPAVQYSALSVFDALPALPDDVAANVETTIKYAGYIEKQQRQIDRFRALEEKKLPKGYDYSKILGLRIEARMKLAARQPENIGQAARISGVSPADIAVLTVWFEKLRKENG